LFQNNRPITTAKQEVAKTEVLHPTGAHMLLYFYDLFLIDLLTTIYYILGPFKDKANQNKKRKADLITFIEGVKGT
jgi:hypothetical protein